MDLISNLQKARPAGGLTAEDLTNLEKKFKKAVGNKKEMDLAAFKKIYPSKTTFFLERTFHIFDVDNSGFISLAEFMEAMCKFSRQRAEEKLQLIFQIYDINNDGSIQITELRNVISECMKENGLYFSVSEIDELTKMLFDDADADGSGCVTFEEFQAQLRRHPAFMENLTLSVERWLLPTKVSRRKRDLLRRLLPHKLELKYIKNNLTSVIFLLVYLFLNTALFISRAAQYWEHNYFVIIARACGQCLNFNCAFLMLLVLRQSLTFLRTHGFSRYLPIDQHLYFHKLIGYFIVGYSLSHTIMHVCNFHQLSVKENLSTWQFLISLEYGGWFGSACPTGWALLMILCIMFFSSLPAVRRRGRFEVFHLLHQLAWVFWICLLFHGKNFWMWIIGPGILYIIERIVRIICSLQKSRKTYVEQGILLPSRVTHLVIKRPPKFVFRSGDYVYVNIPKIARYEWHPFTISSAPEMEDVVWLHIRGVGGWTNTLHDFFHRYDKEAIPSEKLVKNTITASTSAAPSLSSRRLSNKQQSENFLLSPLTNPVNSATKLQTQQSINKKRMCIRSISENALHNYFATISNDSPILSRNLRTTMPSRIRGFSGVSKKHGNKEERYALNKAQVLSVSTIPEDNEKDTKDVVGLNYRDLSNMEEGSPAVVEQSESTPKIKTKRRSVRVSVSNKSFGQSQTAIIMPTLISEDEVFAQDMTLNNDMIIQEHEEEEEGLQNVVIAEKPLKIYLDGPYGSPTRHIFQSPHAVLIATGIGVTPYASILQSIMYKYKISRHTCPNCNHKWTDSKAISCLPLKKVDFFWLNRDQSSFEWFVSLLSELEVEQAQLQEEERFLDMHMYITSALNRADMKAVGLQMAMNLLYQKEKRCLITGLKNRTQPGRPDWSKVFKDLAAQNKGKVTVFFCGSQQLAKTLHAKCDEFGFKFRKEIF